MNNLDKLHIELYSTDGVFQGYLLHLKESTGKVETTPNKYNARSFSTMSAASKVVTKVENITRGCIKCNIA